MTVISYSIKYLTLKQKDSKMLVITWMWKMLEEELPKAVVFLGLNLY